MGKRLGQHFLHDRSVLDAIVVAAALRPGEPVLEIGPGAGALTERLLAAGARLAAVELDPTLLSELEARWGADPRLHLIEGDILRIELAPQALFGGDEPYAVIANLPYYLSTPLLFRMAAGRSFFSRLLLMVQDEVALRMAAGPQDGKDYGSLSVAIQHAFTVRRVLRVPPGAFRPPPKVHSAVVELRPRPPELPPGREAWFFEHIKRLFSRRRKLMISGLREAGQHLPPEQWAQLEALVADRRAETLTPEEHLQVFRLLYSSQSAP
ncbi:MAG TPA: 16S rRNA (adenine(1518)-N(6)/adenine(1519)-N(6))-dimethyltransferase RsmA [bacterium]|nr:16S rRNA (adenine(1518)-N(6)/adenine(1519)-N(6))-dimethyltransferase RsmA [bacterium]